MTEYANDFTVNGKTYAKGKWIGITVPVLKSGLDNDSITYSVDEEDKVIVTTQFNNGEGDDASGLSNVNGADKGWTAAVVIWLQVPDYDKDGTYEHTYTVHLKYTNGATVEECDLNINMINAGRVYIKSIEAAEDDKITKGVLTQSYSYKSADIVPFDAKHGQYDNVSLGINLNGIPTRKINDGNNPSADPVEGKWIKVKITYNVPYDMIKTGEQGGENKTLKDDTITDINTNKMNDGYSEYVWFNLNTKTFEKRIANEYGLRTNKDYASDSYTSIKLTIDDTSALATHSAKLDGYRNMTSSTLRYEEVGSNIASVNDTPIQMQIRDSLMTFNKSGTLIAKNYGHMAINGIEGRWVFAYVFVKANTAKDIKVLENTDAYVLDYNNATALLGQNRMGLDGKDYDILPIWINLDKVYVNENGERLTDEKELKIKLGLNHEDNLLNETLELSFNLKYDSNDTTIPWFDEWQQN